MNALSLWQPWATLIAIGAKAIETRSWKPPERVIGDGLLIHAAQRGLGKEELHHICHETPFREALREGGFESGEFGVAVDALPRGAVVCIVHVVEVSQITDAFAIGLRQGWPREFAFGDYTPGRWAWRLRDRAVFDPPRPAKGARGIFDLDMSPVGAVVSA